jgi:hypothetical protein
MSDQTVTGGVALRSEAKHSGGVLPEQAPGPDVATEHGD